MRIQGFLPALLSGVCALAAAWPASADTRLYQWTDADGRVQYSDRAPESNPAASARSINTQPQLPAVKTFKPLALPPGKLQPLAVALPDFSALLGARKLGRLYIAADCITPTEIGWNELQGGGSIFMDGNRRYLAESAAATLRQLGYDADAVLSDSDWQNMANAGALRLVPKVQVIDARVCASKFTSIQVRTADIPRLIQVSGDRAGLWMQVRWELWRKGERQPFKIFETEGANMQWRENGSLWLVTHEALREATRNLAAYPALASSLRPTSAFAAAKKDPATTISDSVSGAFDAMTARFTLQPKVAQAAAFVSPIKTIVVQFYQENGRWPTDLPGLLPPGTRLNQEGLIDKVALGTEGEIIVSLAESVSPQAWLRLKPTDNHINVLWSCRSNLPAAALGGSNGFCKSEAR